MNSIASSLIKIPILKRLIPSLYKRYVLFFNQYIKEVQINDVYYSLDLRHLIDRRFFFHNGYEDELFNPLNDIINKNKIDFFLDIGSCWGVYSLRFAGIHKNLKILAFDPIKNNIERLKLSIKKNNFKNIEIKSLGFGPFVASYNLLQSYLKYLPIFNQFILFFCYIFDKFIQLFVKTNLKEIYPIGFIFLAKKK